MNKPCEMHICMNCPLCNKPAAAVIPQTAPVSVPTPVSTNAETAQTGENHTFQDTKAVAMLAAAQKFARTTEDLSTIDARITHLESELVTARTHRLEFLAAQVSANEEMRALLDSLAAHVKPHNDAAVAIASKPLNDDEVIP